MQEYAYHDLLFLDEFCQKHKTLEKVASDANSVCLKTEEGKLLKIFSPLGADEREGD